jgi:hypothetical protein
MLAAAYSTISKHYCSVRRLKPTAPFGSKKYQKSFKNVFLGIFDEKQSKSALNSAAYESSLSSHLCPVNRI